MRAYFVPSTVLNILQALMNFTVALCVIGIILPPIVDQDSEVERVNETCSMWYGVFLKIILLARTGKKKKPQNLLPHLTKKPRSTLALDMI